MSPSAASSLTSTTIPLGLWLTTWRGGLLLTLLCLLTYLPGLSAIPVIDRDESRFAQASRQMAQTSDFVVPMVQGRPRLNKPPLIYWAQSLTVDLLTGFNAARDAIWMYRIPSLLAAIGTVLLTWSMGRRMFDGRVAFFAAATLAICPVMFWEARQARADMVLLFFTTLSLWATWYLIRLRPERTVDASATHISYTPPTPLLPLLCLWVGVAGGILTKGPITPMVLAFTLFVTCIVTRSWSLLIRIAPIFGLVFILVTGLPWLFAVMNRFGGDAYFQLIFDETIGRSMAPKEGHSGPPGYHIIATIALFFPGCLGLGIGLWNAISIFRRTWREYRTPQHAPSLSTLRPEVFLLGWLIPSWIIFELVSTKLPHYTMPLYPALALLCAKGLLTSAPWATRWFRRTIIRIIVIIWIAALGIFSALSWSLAAATLHSGLLAPFSSTFAAAAKPITPSTTPTPTPPSTTLFSSPADLWKIAGILILTIGLIWTITFVRLLLARWHQRNLGKLLGTAIAGFIISGMLLAFSAPAIPIIWTSRAILASLNQLEGDLANWSTRPLVMVGYQEDSLIFETRGHIQRLDAADLLTWAAQNPTGLIIIDEPSAKSFPDLIFRGGARGFNYSKGKLTEIVIAQFPQSGSAPKTN